MKITIYSTTTCTFCHALRVWLDKQGFVYDYKLTDEDDTAMQEFMSVNDGMIGVPLTVITKDDGSQEKVLGFDKRKLATILNIQS